MKTQCLDFHDADATRIEFAGGKGANLATLTQKGFPVPPGFVVPADVYRVFIAAGRPRIEALLAGDAQADPARLRAACEALLAELRLLPLPEGLAEDLGTRLDAFPPGTRFSVRSSSTMEDLANAAFAGQHETYLNVAGKDAVLERVRDCFLSLWADRAVAYRTRQAFDHELAAMAVVVQQMVRAEAAGVGFSVNPVSGRLDEMVVNANFGLGESVVSGDGEVDQWILEKATGAVRTAAIARKTRRVVARDTGTEALSVDDTAAALPSLAPNQLAELAALLVRVEQSYGFPQDIEWAVAEGRLHLLQSRPITTIPARWTRDESAERFPAAIAPLTWDFVESGFHRSLNHSFRLLGFPKFDGKWFGMHGHYIYGNQNAVELYGRRAPFAARSLDELRALIPRLRRDFAWVQELPARWMQDLDHHLLTLGRFMAEPLSELPAGKVWEHVLEVNEHGARYFLPNIAISIAHGTLYRTLRGLMQLAVGPADAVPLFDRIMAHCETKTGEINRELHEMATQIRRDPRLAALLAGQASRPLWESGALDAFPEFRARLGRFLRDHGHREVEFDAYIPTWGEAPWIVLDNLRLVVQSPETEAPEARERTLRLRAQEAEAELQARLPEDLRFFFHTLVRLARTYTALDDLEHYQTTRLTLPLRRGLREFGRRLADLGVMSEPMDVFFARQAQVEAALASDTAEAWRDLAGQIRAQKSAYLADRARTPEWNLGETDAESEAGGDHLAGLAGSAGVAEGVVHVVLAAADFASFPAGAVLVARTTNPAWTPLFYSAVAVITESGGPLSHGAVTAREMGIPAVMSVRGCLGKLANGQRVRVDGTAGKVWLLD